MTMQPLVLRLLFVHCFFVDVIDAAGCLLHRTDDVTYGILAEPPEGVTEDDSDCCIHETSFTPITFDSSLGRAVIQRQNLGGFGYSDGGEGGRCNQFMYIDNPWWNEKGWGVGYDPTLDFPCREDGFTANSAGESQGGYCCIEDSDQMIADNEAQEENMLFNNVRFTRFGLNED